MKAAYALKVIFAILFVTAIFVSVKAETYKSNDGFITVKLIGYDEKTTTNVEGRVVDAYIYSKNVTFSATSPLKDIHIEIFDLESKDMVYYNFTSSPAFINCSLPEGNYTVHVNACDKLLCTEFDSYSKFIIKVGKTSAWKADGIISDGEYTNNKSFGKMKVYWKTDGEFLYMALEGKTQGWIAIGFEPTVAMKDADMVIGWVEDGKTKVVDAFSTGTFGPHPPDTALGGSNDLLEFGGKESNGVTIIEFKRKLDTGDRYDKVLEIGKRIKVIWAMANSDNFKQKHIARGSGEIELELPRLIVESVFANNTHIPRKYAFVYCGGQNINPPLYIKNISKKTKSLVIVVEDPDANNFLHWLAWNVEPTTIPENIPKKRVVDNPKMIQGMNDFGFIGYGGPCPPETHHYYFKVYAIDTTLNLPVTATKNDVLNAIKGHVIQEGILIGIFP